MITFSPLTIFIVSVLYLALMFGVAYFVERKVARGINLTNHAVVYTFALLVYATGWSFYGNVGLTATTGYLFTAPLVGVTLFSLFWWSILRRLIRARNEYNITNIAGFFEVRYGKSEFVGALITSFFLVALIPYIALQLIAMFRSYALLTTGNAVPGTDEEMINLGILALTFFFVVMFGFRHLDQSERHPGIMMVVAIQTAIKAVATLAAGFFVLFVLYGGFGDFMKQVGIHQSIIAAVQTNPPYAMWFSFLIFSVCTSLLLPRQFHAAVVENNNEQHVRTAIWLFPLLIFVLGFPAYFIALGGIMGGHDVRLGDLYMLLLPMKNDAPALALLVFFGGLSASLSMVIVSSIALTTMTSNYLIVPIIERVSSFNGLRKYTLQIRWAVVGALLYASYRFALLVKGEFILVKIGILSFAAVFQFVPAFFGALFWKRGNMYGAVLGITAGFAAWGYTMLLPALVRSNWLPAALLTDGPFGIALLRPEHLLGITSLDPLTHTLLVSVVLNVGCYVIGSLLFEQGEEEKHIAYRFINILKKKIDFPEEPEFQNISILLNEKITRMTQIYKQYVGEEESAILTRECLEETYLTGKEYITNYELLSLNNVIEKKLAKYIGNAAAKESVIHGGLFTQKEMATFSRMYSRMSGVTELSPEDLKQKIATQTQMERMLKEESEQLESAVADRTKKLKEVNAELKEINDVAINRELRMIELKETIKKLESQIEESKQKQGTVTP